MREMLLKQKIKILHLEDILSDAELVERELKKSGVLFEKNVVDNKQDFIKALKEFIPDVILSDHKLPSFDSIEALKIISDSYITVPFILVTATVSEEFAVEIMKKGADDYILKDRLQRLPSAVMNAIEKHRLNKERQKYYNQIIENEAMLQQTEQLAHIGSFEVEIKTDLVKWSDECYRIMGYDVNEIVPSLQVFLSRIHPEDLNYVTENIQKTLDYSDSLNIEYRIKLNDGSVRFIRSEFLLDRNDENRSVTIHGFIQDITEIRFAEEGRRKIEKELQATYERLLFHIENSPLGFIEWDGETMVKSWSKRAEEVFGWSEKEFIDSNKSGFSQVYEEDLPQLRKVTEELTNGTVKRNTTQHRNYTKDGRVIWCEWFNSALKDENEKVITIMSLVQDISERKNAEMERSKITDDLVARNKELEQFTYIVSHNLRAPVSNILGFSDVIQNLDLNEEQKLKAMDGLVNATKKLDAVIADLNYILQRKKEAQENKVMIQFYKILEDVKIAIEDMIKEKDVVIKTDFSQVDRINTLKSYMHSIFYNLISNSIKYRQPEMPLIIEITSESEQDKIILRFKDNGMGINLEKKGDQVFGLYKRFHTHVEGKGIGLFMVKSQVEAINGKISVESEENRGTEFKIEFKL
jgi:PAS domain S-box-containing protein